MPHSLGLLCTRTKRPSRRRAAEKRDELAPLHVPPEDQAFPECQKPSTLRPGRVRRNGAQPNAYSSGSKPDVRFGSLVDMCSAKGHVRFGPKADMCGALVHVRFVAIADIRANKRERKTGLAAVCQIQFARYSHAMFSTAMPVAPASRRAFFPSLAASVMVS